MTAPGTTPQDRQPSPGAQPLPTPAVEAPNPIDTEPLLAPVHEEEPPPPPTVQEPHRFQPLFALVTDATTRATHHPRVHYIFSDDDPDVLTEALAQHGAQQHQHKQQSSASPSASGTVPDDRDRDRPRRLSAASAAGRPNTNTNTSTNTNTGPNERVIVLDLVPRAAAGGTNNNPAADGHNNSSSSSGYEVSWASSLSSDWAVVSARISPVTDDINASASGTAGTGTGAADPDDADPQQQLVLRIEGLGADAVPLSSASGTGTTQARRSSTATATGPRGEERDLRMSGSSATAQGGGQGQDRGSVVREDYGAIMDEFDRRMGVLRRVVDAGLERQRRLSAAAAGEGEEGVEDHTGREEGVLSGGTHAHDWGAGGGEQGEAASSAA